MNQSKINFLILILSIFTVFVHSSCQQKPQQVRHLGQEQEVDSSIIAKLQLNTHLAKLADEECIKIINNDSTSEYTIDDFGFWYTKIVTSNEDTIQEGEHILLHIRINDLNGNLISDTKIHTQLGASDLPIAISRSLKIMRMGEQLRIIAPWYTAYGVEGTKIIKPYSNLSIILTIEQ